MTHDKVSALVTGGGSGIGLGIARALLSSGATVTIAGRSAERLHEARQALAAGGRISGGNPTHGTHHRLGPLPGPRPLRAD